MMGAPVPAVLIGAGNRGADSYAPYALRHPGELKFVAVAEPDAERRARFATAHGLPAANCFTRWEDLLAGPLRAEAALVCTQDQLHVAPAVAALEAGYHVLLEKPMAPSATGCAQLVRTAERTGRILQIAHVLRYAPFWTAVHEVVASGRLGQLVTVEHRENVAYWHMAHSYVRGHWRRAADATPMLLAKCCHDLDLLVWNLGEPCARVSSMGSLLHFKGPPPPEIPARCTDGCPVERACPYSAIAIYLDQRPFVGPGGEPLRTDGWPLRVVSHDRSPAAMLQALQTGPYGRCVYRCDNDVVDHQVVAMQFESGVSATLTMHGHAEQDYRAIRYDGHRATLRGRFGASGCELTLHDHLTGEVAALPVATSHESGHGGGDDGLMRAFVRVVRGQEESATTAGVSLESHLIGFAAEQARTTGTVVDMGVFRRSAEPRPGGSE